MVIPDRYTTAPSPGATSGGSSAGCTEGSSVGCARGWSDTDLDSPFADRIRLHGTGSARLWGPVGVELLTEVIHVHSQIDQCPEDELQFGPDLLRTRIFQRQGAPLSQGNKSSRSRSNPADVRGDILRQDLPAGGEHHHALHQVLQLTHVTGPMVVLEDFHGFGRNSLKPMVLAPTGIPDEGIDQQGNVLSPRAEGRQFDM